MHHSQLTPKTLEQLEHNLYGGILYGVDGHRIELQARYFGPDAPGHEWDIRITGMATGAVKEVQGRLAGAFAKHGLQPMDGRILINLAPAGIPKFGTSLDLPIAVICLQAAGYVPDLSPEVEKNYFMIGEVSLHGDIRRINGALPIALCATPGSTLIVPRGNEKECCMLRGLPDHGATRILVAEDLGELVRFMLGKVKLKNALAENPKFEGKIPPAPDFASIKGQEQAKRAMVVAAAGGHNVLMVGPPGEGKSLLASAFPGILPPLSNPEKIELTWLYSAKGLLNEDGLVVSRRPFRAVHHTASKQALIGGGSGVPEPGEITLAHRGVLFMDELAEFSRSTLESLRQPIEAGEVTVSRVDASLSFPARFTLVAAMNPCPCGFHGQYICQDCLGLSYDPKSGCPKCGKFNLRNRCECKPAKVQTYRKKVSGPILDRIDLHLDIRPLSVEEKFADTKGSSSRVLRDLVTATREIQSRRYFQTPIAHNAAIPGGEISKWCEFSPAGFDRYRTIISQGSFSTRATDRMAKMSRTIADLETQPKIEDRHVQEAAAFLSGSPLM
jgi:magnesium chelatase family protein